MSHRYEDEQLELKQQIKNLAKIVEDEKQHEMDSDSFLKIVHKYTEIEELTLEILQEFIDKIVVHHREEIDGERHQKVEIYYKLIGSISLPKMSKKERENYLETFGKEKNQKIA